MLFFSTPGPSGYPLLKERALVRRILTMINNNLANQCDDEFVCDLFGWEKFYADNTVFALLFNRVVLLHISRGCILNLISGIAALH